MRSFSFFLFRNTHGQFLRLKTVGSHLKGDISRMARPLSHHSSGTKNLLERQKTPLNQAYNSDVASSSFSFPTTIRHQILIKIIIEIIVPTTSNQYENNKLMNISSASFLFDFGFQIQDEQYAYSLVKLDYIRLEGIISYNVDLLCK